MVFRSGAVGIPDVALFAADGTPFAGANGQTNRWVNKCTRGPSHSILFHFFFHPDLLLSRTI